MAALASWGWQHPGDLRIARGPCPIEVLSEMDFPKIAAAAATSDQHRAHVPQRRPCRPWNIDALRKLCIFGNAEQWAWAQKAADDIWAGRNGWCPAK